ncbi:hypothetical protein HMSSN139_68260 [Paenibacillus sp. HMSSN-139]|nr:hypothetical protein HMSSN139_68260 [Paenibacillus sp. HMSSN-139]
MTPYELNLHIQAYNERLQREEKEGLTIAYLTAYWGRVKKMPDLKKILGQERKTRAQTPEQMLRTVQALNAAMGGKVVKKPTEDSK